MTELTYTCRTCGQPVRWNAPYCTSPDCTATFYERYAAYCQSQAADYAERAKRAAAHAATVRAQAIDAAHQEP